MVKWLAKRPHYIPLFFAVGWFIARVPVMLGKSSDLRTFVRGLRAGKYPRGPHQTVKILASFWLRRFFKDRNTCYGRALTLYRFLNEEDVKLHMGIQHKRFEGERLRGHAWVSLRGKIVEGPPEAYEGRLSEIPLEQYA